MKIIPRKQAKDNNLKFYFTGNGCKRGHVTERRTTTGTCCACEKLQAKKDKKYYAQWRADHRTHAKQTSKKHYTNNKQQYKDRAAEWAKQNPEKVKPGRSLRNKQFRLANAEYFSKWWGEHSGLYRQKAYAINARKNWNANNKGYKNHLTRLRQRKIKQATPPWADLEKIKSVYTEAANQTERSGVKYEVDHIVPLSGKNVCGLHVAENLQILAKDVHKYKSNKFTE